MKKTKKLSKKHKRIILIGGLAIILIMASVYTVVIRPSMNEVKTTYEATNVHRGMLEVTVNESGSIQYAESSIMYELDLDLSDDDDDDDDDDEETVSKYLVIEEVYKASGEMVSEGDQLLKFTESSIQSVRKLLAAAVADAQVDYNDAKSEYELNCLEAEVDYKSTLITSNYAKKLYNDASSKVSDNISSIQTEITYREGRVTDLQEAITDAQENYNEAYSAYIEIKEWVDQCDASKYTEFLTYQKKYLQAQTTYNNALTSLENAQNAYQDNADQITSLKKQLSQAQSSKNIDKVTAEQEYQENKQSGENAELVYNAKLESLAEDLKDAEDDLKKREKQQEAFEELVGEDGIVKAPKDGLIVAVNVEKGDELTGEKTMVSYVCADALTISVDATEEDVVSLNIGDPVSIVFTAYPEETFEGKITSIDTTATSSGTNTVSYSVVVSLPGDLTKMYGGMTAKVSFQIDRSEDTLYITRKALVEQNGSYYVYVKSGLQDYELKKVTLGLKNTSYAEILSGLTEDDTIYIATTGA